MITITSLHKGFGARDLFRGAELRIMARDRIALVGPNGSGKTTLLDMIAGDQSPDSGEISLIRGTVIGYLRQEIDELGGRSLLEEMLSAGTEVTEAGHRMEILEAEIAGAEPGAERDRLVAEYGRVQDRFSTLGGYSVEAEAKRILAGLGFDEADHERRTESFSGGWLMRIALAKLLLASPDLLMLDEPTNHLDLASVEWLEDFLASYEGAIVLIAHDRDFIDGIATKVVEIDDRKLVSYTGDFESFVAQREERVQQAEARARNRQRKVSQTQRFIDRFRYKASKAKQVQSRIKALGRLEGIAAPSAPKKAMKLAFPQPPRAGRVVVELSRVHFGYADAPVYDDLDLAVERSDKIALVGPNGAGKSTLMKLVAGALKPQAGDRRLGHNARLAYFTQRQIEALEPRNRVLEELESAVPPNIEVRPRDLLGRFLFTGDDVDKRVAVLSGGERTRLALAKLLVSPANLLCLDEPTNHLDMQSCEVLEQALLEYHGALILITHDRHLIRSVANRIIEIEEGRLTVYAGDYDHYVEVRAGRQAEPAPSERPVRSAGGAKERRRREAEARARTSELRRSIQRIEHQLDETARELDRLTEMLADPEIYSSGEDIGVLVNDYERQKRRASRLEAQWEEAVASLEAAQTTS